MLGETTNNNVSIPWILCHLCDEPQTLIWVSTFKTQSQKDATLVMVQIKSIGMLNLLVIQNVNHLQQVRIQAQNIEMTKTMNQIKPHNLRKTYKQTNIML